MADDLLGRAEFTLEDAGFREDSRSDLPAEQARRLASALDIDPNLALAPGRLPLLWHWAYFTPETATARLGADGVPRGGAFADRLPRRMFAGGRVRVIKGLDLGQSTVRRTRLLRVDEKRGRGGPFLLVTVAHELLQRGRACVVEENDLAFLGSESFVDDAPANAGPTPSPGSWVEVRYADPVLLFRFSAITFNAHRIHYDLRYTREVEGYPKLVLHGPLTAMWLAGLAERHVGDVGSFEFRARAPLFAGNPVRLTGQADDHGVLRMSAIRDDGVLAMTATASA